MGQTDGVTADVTADVIPDFNNNVVAKQDGVDVDEFDFEYEEHNEKEGDTPASKETGMNVKKRPLNSPAESTVEPKTAKTSQSQLPVKQRKHNH